MNHYTNFELIRELNTAIRRYNSGWKISHSYHVSNSRTLSKIERTINYLDSIGVYDPMVNRIYFAMTKKIKTQDYYAYWE